MPAIKPTLTLVLAIFVGALSATLTTTNADPMDEGDANENFTFKEAMLPEEFAETSRSTYYQIGKWTIQILDRVEPFAADAYHFQSSYQKREITYCNVFYGSMPVGRTEGPYFGHLGIPEVDGLKARKRAIDTKNPKKSIPLYDLMGDGTLCLVVETSRSLVRGSWNNYEVIRLSESRSPKDPAASKATSVFRGSCDWSIPSFEDFDKDGCFEIVDPLSTGVEAGTCTADMYKGLLPTIQEWDAEREEYVLADPTLFFAPKNKDGSYKSSTLKERKAAAKLACEKFAKEAKASAEKGVWNGWDAWSVIAEAFSELTFQGHPEMFARLFDKFCPAKLDWPYDEKTKKDIWDELVADSKEERARFKKWLPQIMTLKTSKETKTDTPWK